MFFYWLDRDQRILIYTVERNLNLQFVGYRLADEEDAMEMDVFSDEDLINRHLKERLRKRGDAKGFQALFKGESFNKKSLSEEQKNKREDEMERLEKR